MSDFVQQHAVKCSFNTSDSWIILTPIEQSIKSKIEAIGKPLKEWDIQINYGIKTGYNDAFIISTDKRVEILNNCKDDEERARTADLIRPILRGRDIKRYGYTWADLWLIATFPSRHYNIDDFPAVKSYLLSIGKERLEQTGKTHILEGEKVKARKKTNNKWFETQDSISYWEEFSKPKIVWAETMRRHKNTDERFPRFSYDINGVFLDKTCFMGIGADAEYIMVILNSRLGEFLCSKYVSILDNGGYLMQKVYLNEIPIIKAAEENKQRLLSLYKEPHNEGLIDRIIFNQLNFTSEEIEYVEEYLLKQL